MSKITRVVSEITRVCRKETQDSQGKVITGTKKVPAQHAIIAMQQKPAVLYKPTAGREKRDSASLVPRECREEENFWLLAGF